MRNCFRVWGLFGAILLAVFGSVVLGSFTSTPAHAQARGQIISSITVTGNQRIEPETVTSYMEIQKGDVYDAAKVNDSLKILFRTGLFSDVRIFRRGSGLVIQVVENPIINRVVFEGNKEIKTKALLKEVTLRARLVFTTARAQKDVERITTLYRRSGLFAARIVPKIIRLSQNRVDLVYEIAEGKATRIARVNFVGNRAFNDGKLRSVVATAETRWWKFFSKSDNYDPDRLNYDRELLRRHYIKNGYADFRVVSAVAELARDGTSFFITFSVEEGDLYNFGTSTVTSNLRDLNAANLQSALLTVPGTTYNAKLVDKTVDKITEEAGKVGFAFARVRPKINRDRQAKIINIEFVVQEGPRVYIERIEIIGNVRTLDRVIRRELRLVEGDAYNRILVDRARRRITALDFFGKVKINQLPGTSPDKVVLVIKVEEKSTGSLTFGAGFSTAEAVLGDVSITERNFLGKGQFVRLRTSLSFKRQQIDLKFTEPYFLGRKMTFGFDVFLTETNSQTESSFKSRRVGGALRFGFPLSENSAFSVRYNINHSDIFDVATTASLAVQASVGKALTSSIGYTWLFSSLDNPQDPTKGMKLEFFQDLAGLGGDVFYIRTVARAAFYRPIYWPKVIGVVKLSAGNITGWNGKEVRINDRFFKGGDTLRGFERAGIGPRDVTPGTNNDAVGGQSFMIANIEAQFPLGLPDQFGLRGAVFTDWGTLFDAPNNIAGANIKDDMGLRASAGVSVIWKSPLGPLRFDFGHAFIKQSYDQTEIFRFSGGTSF